MGRSARIHRQVALVPEHGSWALYLAPLVIGTITGGAVSIVTAYLVVASLCGFLVRQPVTMWVKVASGRRSMDYRRPALLWTLVYTVVGLLHVYGLVLRGFGFLLWLAVAGVPILIWHLALIARRSERRQLGIELVGASFLALAAPAAYWVARGEPDPRGLVLYGFVLAWNLWAVLQTYLRLAQRTADAPVPRSTKMAPLLVALVPLVVGSVADVGFGAIPRFVAAAFLIPWGATALALRSPSPGRRPRQIGFEMLALVVTFAAVFVALWTWGS